MLRFIVRLFAIFGLLVALLAVGLGVWIGRMVEGTPEELPQAIVLELDLDRPLIEYKAADPLEALVSPRGENLRDIVDALDRARRDPRVKGLVARFGGDRFGLAQAQELRAAVERFRADGRFAYAFAESFGELSAANTSYFAATGFDEIWLQPVGMIGLTGIAAEVPFGREALDSLGVDPQIGQRAEYKSFANSFTERDFTPPHREMIESLVGDLSRQLVEGIARGRRLDPAAVRDLIDRGPFLDTEAVEARLADRLGYADEVWATAVRRAGDGAGRIELGDYLDAAGRPYASGPEIALLYGTGTIVSGSREVDPLSSDAIAADDFVEALDEAVRDPDVRAIVLRLDSGGGSAVASETIRRAILQARAASKPVVVSMSGAAASGAYWIASAADRIVAQPGTLTGSIGVLGGKFTLDELSREIGIGWGTVAQGRNATIWSPLKPYSEGERSRIDAALDRIYQSFIERVAQARNLPQQAVEQIAKGRVWTGAQAKEHGLVDELGGLHEALELARARAGIGAGTPVTVTVHPRPTSPLRRLLELAQGRTGAPAELAVLARVAHILEPVIGLLEPPRVLQAPDLGMRTDR